MLANQITLITAVVFVGMLCFMEVGRRIGRFRIHTKSDDQNGSYMALEGSVFALMGLLVAFTFSAAASRFEMRRQLAVEETNDIGTSWKRLDLLPPAHQSVLRGRFRQYIDARLSFYQSLADQEQLDQALAHTRALQDQIWIDSVAACKEVPSPAVSTLVLGSTNAMIDITTTRAMAAQTHLPAVIQILLVALPLICSLLAGLDMAAIPERSWVRTVGFALMVSITVFVILDLDYPRVGLIRLNQFDQGLMELRAAMQSGT